MRIGKTVFLLLVYFIISCSSTERYDIIIRGGIVVDGTGSPPDTTDVGIRWDKIKAIGDLSAASADTIINAEGMYVAPGFIDIHSRVMYDVLADGRAISKLQQGITTVIMGEDESPGPVYGDAIPYTKRKLSAYGLNLQWSTLGDFLDALSDNGVSVNVGSYVGYWQVRGSVVEFSKKYPQKEQAPLISFNLINAMQEGAMGISVGFTGIAEWNLRTVEVNTIGYFINRYGGILAIRVRYEDERAPGYVRNIADFSNIPIEILELKITGKYNPAQRDQTQELLDAIDLFRSDGQDVTANIIPYPMFIGVLSDIIPLKYKQDGRNMLATFLRDEKMLPEIEKDILNEIGNWDSLQEYWSRIRIIEVFNDSNKKYVGKTLHDISGSSPNPLDTIVEMMLSEPFDIPVQIETIDESFIRAALEKPWVKLCTGAPTIYGIDADDKREYSILYYAAFPGALAKYVRDDSFLTIQEMIKKMTSMNSDRLNIHDRGRIMKGQRADIVVFDLDAITPVTSTMVSSEFDTGVRYVFVNGALVFDNGRHTGKFPGEILLRARKK